MREVEMIAADAASASLDGALLQRLPMPALALDARGRIVFWNDACVRLTGYAADEALSDPRFVQRLCPRPGQSAQTLIECASASGLLQTQEQPLRTRSGATLTVAWSELPAPAAMPDLQARWFVGCDVTAACRAREALRHSEARLQQLMASERDLIAIYEPDGSFRFLNAAVTPLLGYVPAELRGTDAYALFHPEDRASLRQVHEQLLNGKFPTTARYRARRKDGQYAWLETVVSQLFEDADDPRRVSALLAVSRDVSDRLEASSRLAASEERLRLALLSTGVGIYDMHLPTVTGHISDECLRVYGYGPGQREAFEHGWLPLVHPDDCASYVENLKRRDRGAVDQLEQEARRMHSDGQYRWMRSMGVVAARDGAGRAVRIIGTVQDIDARKRSELALRDSQARLEQAQALAHVGDWRSVVGEPQDQWSDEVFRLLGRSRGRCVPGLPAFLAALHPDDVDAVRRAAQAAAHEDREYAMDSRVVWPDGSVHHLHHQTRVLRDLTGRKLGLAGTMQDVSERKRAETALRATAAALENAQRIARVGSWSWTIGEQLVDWTAQQFRIFGLDPDGPAPPYTEHAALYTPASWRRLEAAVEAACIDGVPYEVDLEIVRQDGSTGWATAHGEIARDASGRIVGLFGTLQDTTERMRAEIELREARDHVRAFSSHLEDELNLERKRIAIDVHDELGQMLTAMKLQLDLLQSQLGDRASTERSAARLRELIEDTIEVTRNVAMNLRPPALDLGLVAALEWLAEDFALRSDIACSVRAGAGEVALSDKQATELFRIGQESLTNVARHSGASQVEIRLTLLAEGLVMRIQDNGRGFDPGAPAAHTHFGLLGMRERALRLGAELHIASRPGDGCEIRVGLPIQGARG